MANQRIDTEEVIAKALYRMDALGQGIASALVSFDAQVQAVREEYFKEAREHLKRSAVLIPVDSVFKVGETVEKVSGYRFPGIVVGVAQKLDGKLLYLVECIAPGAEGMCHIYSETQLKRATPKPEGLETLVVHHG